MSYINISPGRLRRMTYEQNRITNEPIRRRRNAFSIPRENEYNEYIFYRESVSTGLINSNLFLKSYITLTHTDDNFCVICQNDISNMSIVRKLNCNHMYHLKCIDKWFMDKTHCPTCKYNLLD